MTNRKRDGYHFAADDEVVEDGHSVRVPMTIMDAGGPGRVSLADTVRYDGGDLDKPNFVRQSAETSRSAADAMAGRKRGYLPLADADAALRQQSRAGMIDRLQSAWRNFPADAGKKPPPDDDDDEDDTDDCGPGMGSKRRKRAANADAAVRSLSDARRAARAAHDAMCARLRDAWRAQPGDASQPDYGSRLPELERHLRGQPSGAADPGIATAVEQRLETERGQADRARRERDSRLSEAWRHPR